MKILYMINHAGKAGAEKYVLNLAKAYKDRAECFFVYNEEGLLLEQMKEEGIPTFWVKMRNPFDLDAAKKIAKICDENDIDIIHTHFPRENYIAILSRLFRKKTKVIYTCHLTLKTNFLWKICNKIITRHNAKIISVCNNGKDLMIGNGVPADIIEVIFNGLEYKEEVDRTSTIREEIGVGEDTFVATTLARYHIAKGLPYLVDSIAELEKIAKRDFRILIAGDGELFEEIKEKIHSLGLENKILQLGFRRDTQNILNGSDIFINSAKCFEALSFAILEALGTGLPVIATGIGGNPDIINEKTDCGFIVEYNNPKDMAQAINRLMEDKPLYDKFALNAKKAIKEVFNIDVLHEDIFNLYKRVLGEEK